MAFFDLIVPDLWFLDKSTGQFLRLGDNYTPLQRAVLTTAHEQIRDGQPIRMIVLKARQMGCSTITQAMMLQFLLAEQNTAGMTMAHESDAATGIHKMIHRFWMRAPRALHLTHRTVSLREKGIAWDNESAMRVATAGGKDPGRSSTIRAMHNSEVAFYQNPEIVMGGLDQAIPRSPHSIRIVESTANGVGNFFHGMWEDSVANPSLYRPLFFAWWQHPFYTADHIRLGHLADRPVVDLTSEEKVLVKVFRKLGMDLRDIRSRLIWRREFLRIECRGDLNLFHQEYPTTPDEAFISTGRNVFNLERLSRVYQPRTPRVGHLFREGHKLRFVEDETGPYSIYREPSRSSFYTVGGDPSRGPQGDWAAADVLDRKTWEQVATFKRRGMHGAEFADEMMKLGAYYNQALLAPEVNLAGDGIAQILRAFGYPHIFLHQKANKVPGQHDKTYGWVTNHQTKAEAIGYLQKAILDSSNPDMPGGLIIHDAHTFAELKGYVNVGGKYMNGNGTDHDDTVMSLAIALAATIYEAAALYSDTPPTAAGVDPHELGLRTIAEQEADEGFGRMEHAPPMTHEITEDEDGGFSMPAAALSKAQGGWAPNPWGDGADNGVDWDADSAIY